MVRPFFQLQNRECDASYLVGWWEGDMDDALESLAPCLAQDHHSEPRAITIILFKRVI